jgi:nucleotide-binding universal stress UspA family protein
LQPKIVIAYDATPAAADGLALGGLLADLTAAELIVARVLEDTSTEATDRAVQATFRTTVRETREAAAAVLGDRPFELWPIFGSHVAEGILALAADCGAGLIVFGSPHHGPGGRVLLGSSAEAAFKGAPCAVAVAPRGFREHAALDPRIVGVAFDDSEEAAAALDAGAAIAGAARATLRVIAVEPEGWSRPIRHPDRVAADSAHRCADLAEEIPVQSTVVHGDPARKLVDATERLGLLVCGARAQGPLRRVILGSVSSAVIRSAACPVVVVPRHATRLSDDPAAAVPSAASGVPWPGRRWRSPRTARF